MGEASAVDSKKKILIINPNSTISMTDGLKPLVNSLGFTSTDHTFFTSPSGPTSINNESDAAVSADHCLPALTSGSPSLIESHDGFLVACYSQHPLVPLLKADTRILKTSKPVTGIFESSVATSLQLIHPSEKFGIISTGKVWETILAEAVEVFLSSPSSAPQSRFAGVETTGLNATELHDMPAEEVRKRMKDATKRLLQKQDVGAVCLGCAGMAGFDEIVREAAIEELGEELGTRLKIVDGVKAGVAWLEGALRCDF